MESYHFNDKTSHYVVATTIDPHYSDTLNVEMVYGWLENIFYEIFPNNIVLENFNDIFLIRGDIDYDQENKFLYFGAAIALRALRINRKHQQERLDWLAAVVTPETYQYICNSPTEDQRFIITDMLEMNSYEKRLWEWQCGEKLT